MMILRNIWTCIAPIAALILIFAHLATPSPVPDITCIINCADSSLSGIKRSNETNVLASEVDKGAGLLGLDFNYGSHSKELRNKQTLEIGDTFESLETKKNVKQKESGFSLFGFRFFNFGSTKKTASADHLQTFGT